MRPAITVCRSYPSRSELSRAFSMQTTIHGVRRLSDGPSLYRAVWLLFVFGTFVGFLVHLGQLLTRYVQFPVNTESFEGLDDFQFPAVTVCPNDYIHYHYHAHPIPNVYGSNRSLFDMVYDLARIWYRIKSDESSPVVIPYYPYRAYDDGKYSLNQVAYRSQQFQNLWDTVVSCSYNSRDCNYSSEFAYYRDPVRFLCFTFTPSNSSLVQTEEGKGLFLLLYSYANSFLTEEEEINHIPGFSVHLHEPGVAPDMSAAFKVPLEQRVSAQVHRSVETKLDRSAYHCSESLGHVTYAGDPGALDGVAATPPHLQHFRASQRDCLVRQRQLEFLDRCGCLADYLAIPVDLLTPNVRPCHYMWEPAFFVDVMPSPLDPAPRNDMSVVNFSWPHSSVPFETFYLDNLHRWAPLRQAALCFNAVQNLQSSRGQGSGSGACTRLCRRVDFPVTLTSTKWPPNDGSEYSLNATNSSLDLYLDRAIVRATASGLQPPDGLLLAKARPVSTKFRHFAVLDLRAGSSNSFHSSEDWVYPMRNLLSDLGGILGLWMGASIITVVELIEFLIRLGFAPMASKADDEGNNNCNGQQQQANNGPVGKTRQGEDEPPSFTGISSVTGRYLDLDLTS